VRNTHKLVLAYPNPSVASVGLNYCHPAIAVGGYFAESRQPAMTTEASGLSEMYSAIRKFTVLWW
jgi:hypothetical protein